MKKILVLRIVPIFLSVVLMVPCFVVPAKAALAEALTILSVIGDVTAVMEFADSVRDFFSGKTMSQESDWHMDSYLASGMADELDYYYRQESLEDLAEDWNVNFTQYSNGFYAQVGPLGDTGYGCVRLVPSGGDYTGYRVLCGSDHTPILSENYEYGAGRVDGSLPDKWIKDSGIMSDTPRRLLSYEDLNNKAQDHNGLILRVGNFYMIYNKARDQVLASPVGIPYSAQYNPDQWASGSDRGEDSTVLENGVVIEGDVEGNMTNIDFGDMTLTLPDGSINFIDQIIYDEGTKTYHIDAHDEYNSTVNNYYTWNYHINYTSITYIGQTEEYNKYYEVYYELPDGRDSADLTKEELEQLNLSIDVIPYGRSADDTSLRSLYHFDGDTRDSSYWNYCTDFNWFRGASLTYMDAGVFDGALYLDETEHAFELVLPSTISMQDFTLQFRYYQSATAAPVRDTFIQMGSRHVVQFDGQYIYDYSGNQLAKMPVGTWNEIAIMRESKTVYIYLNGVRIGSYSYPDAIGDKPYFCFGSEQQTFKYLDELRVLNYALQTGGANYECTSVPHDTNLTLVLPDEQRPAADEYWVWDTAIASLWSQDFTTGYSNAFVYNYFTGLDNVFSTTGLWHGGRTSIKEQHGFTTITSSGDIPHGRRSGTGLTFPISGSVTSTPEYADFTGFKGRYQEHGNAGTYTFSLVTRDGEVCSLTFDMFYPIAIEQELVKASADFDWGSIKYVEFSESLDRYTGICIMPKSGVPLDFVYMEIVKGSTPNLNHEFVQKVIALDKVEFNTPTLAVRTDYEITGYQIGGVRPSVPTKGQVWALVENQRITSIQIYTGQAWESCDGRIWTGERWIPASSYNIVTLQDMYDIVDSTPDYEYIYTESGFWSWWQKSWNAFTDKLFDTLGSGGSGGSSSIVPGDVQQSASSALSSLIEGIFGVIIEVLKSLIGAAQDLLSGIFGFLTDTVFGGVKDFFSSFDELISPFQSTVENEDGTVTTTSGLPEGIASFYSDLVAMYMALPVELRSVLFFGIGLLILLGVFKLVVA